LGEICDKIYLGSKSSAESRINLQEHGITHVINTTEETDEKFPESFKYLSVKIWDSPTQEILPYFEECFNFIDNALEQNGAVLVHCAAGISRSPSFVIGYLMRKRRMSFEDAFQLVKSKRPIIEPNYGFIHQLQLFEKMNFGYNSKKYERLLKEFPLEADSSVVAICLPFDKQTIQTES